MIVQDKKRYKSKIYWFRRDRNLSGGGVMLLIYKYIPHIPLSELEEYVGNPSETDSVKFKISSKTSRW